MTKPGRIQKTRAEWRAQLTPEQFAVTRRGATEPAFTGAHYGNRADGEYRCVCCGALLFSSKDKYDSGSGWPSFTRPAERDAAATSVDRSLGMVRTEASCARCDAHLGHVFPDGPPQETGERWCINSAALDFRSSTSGGDDR
ncbi:MAG: peptide-methionine (R)-S-oxide reductase MsrB [Acidobacteriota bacterium]|nr:peptide-methionine (R)-S-oxide reductase MsrB [Acidobacteriota bacterium]